MSLYTIHVPDEAPDAMTRGERTVFLREGFSLAAFLFGLFYLLWHRLWAAAVLWLALSLALLAFAVVLHPPLFGMLLLAVLMRLYLGTEGRDLVRWGLGRRGYTMRDIVSGSNLAEAETLFFTRNPDAVRPASSTPIRPVHSTSLPQGPAVIGGFLDGEGA